MELVKKNVRLNCIEKKYERLKTLEDDINVPELKGDIKKIVCNTHEIVIENMKSLDEKSVIKGYIVYDILYVNDEEKRLEHMEGKIPFEESVNVDDKEIIPRMKCNAEIEDFTVKTLNSRKINVRILVKFCCSGTILVEDEIVTEAQDKELLCKSEMITYSQLCADTEDSMRIKEEITLPKNKPDIAKIIWSDMRIKSREVRIVDDGLWIKGNLGIFMIYKAEDDNDMVQWYETAMPFEGKLDISGIDSEMFAMTNMIFQEKSITVKADADGEDRMICAEGLVKIDLKAYSEKEMQVITDMYSTKNNVNCKCEEKNYNQIMLKNNIKAKGFSKIKLGEADEVPLQVCYSYGDAYISRIDESKENQVCIEGFVDADIIYVSDDDTNPIVAIKCQVPFRQEIDLPQGADNRHFTINIYPDQINVSMVSKDEIEVRAYVDIDILVMNSALKGFITDVQMIPMTVKELAGIPRLIGYIASEEESIWNIAKKYKTTEKKIRDYNENVGEKVRAGEKLLIVR